MSTDSKPHVDREISHSAEVRRLTGAMGAEVVGINLAKELNERPAQLASFITHGLREHIALFFPGQTLSPAALACLLRPLGKLGTPADGEPGDGEPGIYEVTREAPGPNRYGYWQTGGSIADRPVAAMLFYPRELPDQGEEILLANTYLAYEALSESMKAFVNGLRAERRSDGGPARAAYPIVRKHPETGRRALYLSPHYDRQIAGMARDESQPLLDFLQHLATTRPEFQLHYRWQSKTLGIWDNRCSMHFEISRPGPRRRVLQRADVIDSALG